MTKFILKPTPQGSGTFDRRNAYTEEGRTAVTYASLAP
jgi:hypothetical protein